MNLRQLAVKTYNENKEYMDTHRITPSHLQTMYKVYYNSLTEEVFNPNKEKMVIYMNEFSKFKDTGVGWIYHLKKWDKRLCRAHLSKTPNPLKTIEIFQMKLYPLILNEMQIVNKRIEDLKKYLDYDLMTYEQVMKFNERLLPLRSNFAKITKLLEKLAKKSEKQWEFYSNKKLNTNLNESKE